MSLFPYTDEDGTLYFAGSKEPTEMVDFWVNRNGDLYAKITTERDSTVTLKLGEIKLPNEIKKLGNKIYKTESSKWIVSQIKQSPILKIGDGNSFYLGLKFQDRTFQRSGKFRE